MSQASPAGPVAWRDQLADGDEELVRRLCQAAGNFWPEEVLVAVELVQERRAKGLDSGYHFIFSQPQGHGYSCFGPIACTDACWDLYWIVVDPTHQGQGLGAAILAETQRRASLLGGRRLYVETSSREQYRATRAFYQNRGYRQEAVLTDFYAPGDHKVIFSHDL